MWAISLDMDYNLAVLRNESKTIVHNTILVEWATSDITITLAKNKLS